MVIIMKNKKGQGSASGLITIILVLILFYILFLPPADREELLQDDDDDSYWSSSDDENITLLVERPGTLSYISQEDADQDIPNIFLTETTNAMVIEEYNPFLLRNGWFNKVTKELKFHIDDFENTDNVMLTFSAPVNQGILVIKINGETVYEYDLSSVNVQPITIEKTQLQEDNVISFEVSGVGMKFWSTNEYSLEEVKVIGDVTDTTRQKSKNIFTLSSAEFQNLDDASIRFIPYCSDQSEVGILDLLINNRVVYSAVPVCDDPVDQTFSTDILDEGQNDIVFISHKGSYSVEQIKINLPLKDSKTVSYYFELNESTYDDVINGTLDSMLKIEFVDNDEEKKGEVSVNGHRKTFELDDDEYEYEKNINNWLEEGNNYLEIMPKSDLYIVELRVEVFEE